MINLMAQMNGAKSAQSHEVDIEDIARRSDMIAELKSRGVIMKQNGGEWKGLCPFHKERTPSFTVRIEDGKHKAKCFGCGEGGDVVDIVEKLDGLTTAQAIEVIRVNAGDTPLPAIIPTAKPETVIAPSDAMPDDTYHSDFGEPEKGPWVYRNEDGGVAMVVYHYRDPATGKKEPRALVPTPNRAIGGFTWRFTWPERRPALWVDEVINSRGVVYVAEGEKAAQRIRDLGFVATTWSGGTNSVDRTDWSFLGGRDVILCPDNDEPGRSAMQYVLGCASQSEATSVRMLEAPLGAPKGWDIADEEGDASARSMLEDAKTGHQLHKRRIRLAEIGLADFAGELDPVVHGVGSPSEGKGILPQKGSVFMAGKGGSGKTTSAILLALKTAAPKDPARPMTFWGFPLQLDGIAVILTSEDGKETIKRTLQTMCRHAGIDMLDPRINNRFVVKTYVGTQEFPVMVKKDPKTGDVVATEEFEKLKEELRELSRIRREKIALIAWDNMATMVNVNSNDQFEVTQAMTHFNKLFEDLGCLGIDIGHTKKNVADQNGNISEEAMDDSFMGSSGWASAHRMTLILTAPNVEKQFEWAEEIGLDVDKENDRGFFTIVKVGKGNLPDLYKAPMRMLRTEGFEMKHISDQAMKDAKQKANNRLIRGICKAVEDAWNRDFPMQNTDKTNGLFARRKELPKKCHKMKREDLHELTTEMFDLGWLVQVKRDDADNKTRSYVRAGTPIIEEAFQEADKR